MGLAPVPRQVGPSSTAPLPMASGEAFGAGVGRAIEGVGEGISRLDRVNRQIEANEQNAAGAKAIGDYQVKLAEATQDARANAAAGGSGFSSLASGSAGAAGGTGTTAGAGTGWARSFSILRQCATFFECCSSVSEKTWPPVPSATK